MAEIALRDALAAARAHIMRLEIPESAISWLYWFARAECRRRWPVLPDMPGLGEEPAGPDGRARLIAWNTVLSLDAAELEALDLAFRHDVKPELVLGVPPEQVQVLVDRARLALERALSAEIVISRGMPDCPDRAKVLADWAGTVTPELRERALRHAAHCPVCGPARPANVSPARVLAMLPWPVLSPSARQEMDRVLREHRPSRRRRLPWVRVLLAGTVAAAVAFGYVLFGTAGGSAAGLAPAMGGPAAGPARVMSGPVAGTGPASSRSSAVPGTAFRRAGSGRAGSGRAGFRRPRPHSRGLLPVPSPSGSRKAVTIAGLTHLSWTGDR